MPSKEQYRLWYAINDIFAKYRKIINSRNPNSPNRKMGIDLNAYLTRDEFEKLRHDALGVLESFEDKC